MFTTIVNPSDEETAMSRTLERPKNKAPAKKKEETARLVVANGNDMGEAARIGFKLAGAGLSAAALGLLEGMARKGSIEWWAKLRPGARGMVMVAFTVITGVLARRARHHGKHREAAGLEASGVSAWTLAIIYFMESGPDGGATQGLGAITRKKPGELGVDDLEQLDHQIDDDIRGAVDKLKNLAEAHRETEEEAMTVGALEVEGDALIELDDDEDLY